MTRRVQRRQVVLSMHLKRVAIVAALLVFGAGIFYLGVEFAKPPPPPDFSKPAVASTQASLPGPPSPPLIPPSEAAVDRGAESEFPEPEVETRAALPQKSEPLPAASGGRPRVALVIDDLGRSLRDIETLTGLGVPMTYAVLPFESLTPQVVRELARRGEEIFCHLPMEPKSGANPGPGALRSNMSDEELTAATQRALAAVPGAIGANNHMGSGLSAQKEAMASILKVLSQRGLYYLDSRTTADTVGYSTALQLGMATGERQVFLDNQRDIESIRAQFRHLLKIAEERGQAIAIGHPYPETLQVLLQEVPRAQGQIEFVRASSLLGRG